MQNLTQALFVYRFINFKKGYNETELPFVLGGATQQGWLHKLDSINNQDAVSISIGNDIIIGIICDGCTSTHDKLQDSSSNNEIGSKLTGRIFIHDIHKIITNKGIEDPHLFIKELSENVLQRLQQLVTTFCDEDTDDKELFIFDLLTTTILGFVVTKDKYIIFSSGDGIIGINNDIKILEDTGIYFGEKLLHMCCPGRYHVSNNCELKVIDNGETMNINNIFLATDGFCHLVENNHDVLLNFIKKNPKATKNGFDNLMQEFIQNILSNDAVTYDTVFRAWPEDDASFLLLRKVDNKEKLSNIEKELK